MRRGVGVLAVAVVLAGCTGGSDKTAQGLADAVKTAGITLKTEPRQYLEYVMGVCDKSSEDFGALAGHYAETRDAAGKSLGEPAMRAAIGYVCPDRSDEWATAYEVHVKVDDGLRP